ncbi:MAG: histidine phosphatase family protein [Defluviitaleaceae bacterium]|nr:histidine phosphatase family protein [Defluviitaleaceae bacterium]
MIELVLVRHGFSEGNKRGVLSGWSNVPLAKEGIEDLQEFKRTLYYPPTQIYYSSDLHRCIHTFDILFGDKVKLTGTRPEFREINFGIYEDMGFPELDIGAFSKRWVNDEIIGDAEQYSKFTHRIVSGVENLCKEMKETGYSSCTLVCHSGVIRAVYSHINSVPPPRFWWIDVPNGRGLHITLPNGARETDIFAGATINEL